MTSRGRPCPNVLAACQALGADPHVSHAGWSHRNEAILAAIQVVAIPDMLRPILEWRNGIHIHRYMSSAQDSGHQTKSCGETETCVADARTQ